MHGGICSPDTYRQQFFFCSQKIIFFCGGGEVLLKKLSSRIDGKKTREKQKKKTWCAPLSWNQSVFRHLDPKSTGFLVLALQ